MTITIAKLYPDWLDARRTVEDLEAAGLGANEISILVKADAQSHAMDNLNSHAVRPETTDAKASEDSEDKAEIGGAIGAVVGGTAGVAAAGVLASLGALAIPGVGPVTAVGWLTTMALGGLSGGVAGGITAALAKAGIEKDEAQIYADGVSRGETLVTICVPDNERVRYETILRRG